MKKRLLLSLTLALGALSSFAFNVGDYVFTPTARLKVTGENIVQNGNFSNQMTSWAGQDGVSAVSTDNWAVAEGQGPDGVNALQSINGGDGLDNYIYQSVSLSSGQTYIVSLQVKTGATASVGTSTTVGQANYVDAYVNADGSVSKDGARQIFSATDNVIGTDWTTISDTIVANSDQYLVIGVGRLEAGSLVTNFSVQTVTNVFDTRIAERRIAYDKQILALPEFSAGKDDLQSMVEQVEACIQANDWSGLGLDQDDPQAMSDFMNQFSELEKNYFDANSYDLIAGNVINGRALWSNKVQKGAGNYGDWYVTGGRWMHNQGSEELRDDYPGYLKMPDNKAEIQKSLPAGKYFFQVEAMALPHSGQRYDVNYDGIVTNKLYIGNDSTEAETLSTREYKTYFIIADVAAGATPEEKNLIAGFQHSKSDKGANVYYKNPVLRLISTTAADDITKFDQDNKKAVQLNAAKVMIDSANVVVNKEEYPWGKEELKSATAKQQALYDALDATPSTELLFVLDADGNKIDDGNDNFTTKTVADSLTQVMRDMRIGIQDYYHTNAPYTNLVAQVAASQKTFDDPDNANASASTKTALQNELDKANAIITTFKAQTEPLENDSTTSANQVQALQTAEENFTASTATYANPSEITIDNPLMTSGPSTGWDTTGSATDSGRWKAGTKKGAFEGDKMWNVSRGFTAYSKNNAKQKVTLTHAGAYEFITQYYGYNVNGGRDGNVTTDHHNYFFAKLDTSADSIAAISIHTNRGNVVGNWDQRAIDTLGYGGQVPEYFVITYNKTDETPTEIQWGIDCMQNSGSNIYAFGGNHVRYYGDYARYKADVLSTLQAEIAKAQATLDSYKAVADSVEYKALKNNVLAATSAIDGTTLAYPIDAQTKAPYLMTYVGWSVPAAEAKRYAQTNSADDQKAALETKALLTLQRAEATFNAKKEAFDAVITGIKGVTIAEDADDAAVKANAKGVYTIAGQKVAEKAENLPAGLYIVNGKKVVIK